MVEQHILEMINSHIIRIENALKTDIHEIKSDLKDLKESQIKLAEVIVKLGTVEDKYNVQLSICREARGKLDKLKEEITLLEKRIVPIEQFLEDFSYIKRKFIVGIGLAIVTGLATFVLSVIKWIN